MAKNRNQQQQRNTGRQSEDMSESMDTDEEQSMGRTQQRQTRGGQQQAGQQVGQQQGQRAQGAGQQRGGQLQTQSQGGDIWNQVKPAFDEARTYIEGSPVRAAAIGAIAGGLLMTLFSTEKGRSFVKMAYDYANPMVAKYARDFISEQAGNMADSALSQH